MEDPLASTSMDVDLGLTPADFLLPDLPEPVVAPLPGPEPDADADAEGEADPTLTAAAAASDADPNLAALPFADAAIPPAANPLKRARSGSPVPGESEPKRPRVDYTNPAQVKLTEAERRAVLAADPIARTVESNRVFCTECKKWVKLGDGVRFRIKHWAGHCALVHKRDKETAGRIVEQGIKDAEEAAALKAAGLLVEEPPPPPVVDDKNKLRGGRWPNSNIGKGVPGKRPVIPGGPPVTRSTYETRATGKPSIPDPRLPVRYNYEDEIPEPYDFSDGDKTPPPPLPPRMRKSLEWFGRHTTHGLDALRRRYAGEPSSASACSPPRKLTARELRAQTRQDPSHSQPGVFFLRPRDMAGRRPGGYWEVVPRQEVVPLPGGRKGKRVWVEERAGVVIQPTNVRNIEPIDVTDYSRRERVMPVNGNAERERVMPVGDTTMDFDLEDGDADADGEEDALGSPDDDQLEYAEDELNAGDESVLMPDAPPPAEAAEPPAESTEAQQPAAEEESIAPPAPTTEELVATQEDTQNTAVVPVNDASAATVAVPTSAVVGLEDVQPEASVTDAQPEAAAAAAQPDASAPEVQTAGSVTVVQPEAAAAAPPEDPQPSTSAPEVIPPTPVDPPAAPRVTTDDEDQWMGLKPPPLSPSMAQPSYSLMIEDFMSPVGTPALDVTPDKKRKAETTGFVPRVVRARAAPPVQLLEAWERPSLPARFARKPGLAADPVRPLDAARMPLPTLSRRLAALTAEEQHQRDIRRLELQKDPDVRAISVDAVQCHGCGRWFKLSVDLYTASRWYGPKGHKRKCGYLSAGGRRVSLVPPKIEIPPRPRAFVPPPQQAQQQQQQQQQQQAAPAPAPAPAQDESIPVANDPRIREIRGDRVQCGQCGRWTFSKRWHDHITIRCKPEPAEPAPAQPSVSFDEEQRVREMVGLITGHSLTPSPAPLLGLDDTSMPLLPELTPTPEPEAPPPEPPQPTTISPAELMAPPPQPAAPPQPKKEKEKPAKKPPPPKAQAEIAQRRAELARDPAVRALGEDGVQCNACGAWVKLGEMMYAAHKWDGRMGHKARCAELLKKTQQAQPPKKKKPTQEDFYIPEELKHDPNIRQFDGDYVQCNHCGKWLVQENWKIHVDQRCSRLKRSKPTLQFTTVDVEGDDESSLSEVDEDDGTFSLHHAALPTVAKGKEKQIRRASNATRQPGMSASTTPVKPAAASSAAGTSIVASSSANQASRPTQNKIRLTFGAANAASAAASGSGSGSGFGPAAAPVPMTVVPAPEPSVVAAPAPAPPRAPAPAPVVTPASAPAPAVVPAPAPVHVVEPSPAPAPVVIPTPTPAPARAVAPAPEPVPAVVPAVVSAPVPAPTVIPAAAFAPAPAPAALPMRAPTPPPMRADTPPAMRADTPPAMRADPVMRAPTPPVVPIVPSAHVPDGPSAAAPPPVPQVARSFATPTPEPPRVTPPRLPDIAPAVARLPAIRPATELRNTTPGPSSTPPGGAPGAWARAAETSAVDYQLLRRRLLENPAVRNVEGERLQCNYCGKWLAIDRWEHHAEVRCRHKPKAESEAEGSDNGNGSSSKGRTSQDAAGSSSSTYDMSALPFNREDISGATPGPGRTVMTQEMKDALAADILRQTIKTRIDELKADPDVRDIGDGTVLCNMCGNWVKLSNHMYAAHRWFGPNGHKVKCPQRPGVVAPPPVVAQTPAFAFENYILSGGTVPYYTDDPMQLDTQSSSNPSGSGGA